MYDFTPILHRIKLAKSASGMTNEELSAKSGIAAGTLNKILSGGTKEPKLPAIMAIAEALGVSADYLIYGVERSEGASVSTCEAALLDGFRSLNPEGQEKILSYVNDLIQAGIYKNDPQSYVVSKEA